MHARRVSPRARFATSVAQHATRTSIRWLKAWPCHAMPCHAVKRRWTAPAPERDSQQWSPCGLLAGSTATSQDHRMFDAGRGWRVATARLPHLLALLLRRGRGHSLLTLLRALLDLLELLTVVLDAAGPLHSVSQRTPNQTSATSAPGQLQGSPAAPA